uniref:Uncharacterized protein n=1 Tax=Anopheles atroparvus TaxID=41427 RepID=A0A182J9J2_ANOAO
MEGNDKLNLPKNKEVKNATTSPLKSPIQQLQLLPQQTSGSATDVTDLFNSVSNLRRAMNERMNGPMRTNSGWQKQIPTIPDFTASILFRFGCSEACIRSARLAV